VLGVVEHVERLRMIGSSGVGSMTSITASHTSIVYSGSVSVKLSGL
jgi:hypothetical protein